MVFCTQTYLARRYGMLQARSTTPTEEWTRSHCSAVQDASTRSNDDKKPSLNFDDGFEEGFAFTGLLAGSGNRGFHSRGFHPNGSGNRGFHPNSDRFTCWFVLVPKPDWDIICGL